MFEKTKKFVKDHHKEILGVAVGAAVGVAVGVGYLYGTRSITKNITGNGAMKIIYDVLNDIPDGAKVRVYGGINNPGLTPNELGELGVDMVKRGADKLGDTFTHFIAIKKEP